MNEAELVNKGERLYNSNQVAEAIKFYTRAIVSRLTYL